jgi:hypothetical protein
MADLTATELRVLNNLSKVRNPTVSLGTLLQAAKSAHPGVGTPVNAVAASKLLTLTGVVIDGETLTIGNDVYEFLGDTAQTKTVPTHKPIDISGSMTKSSVVLTVAAQPAAGETITLGTKVYTFVPNGTANANGEISVEADLAGAKLAIVAAINGTDGFNIANTKVSAAAFNANTCTITALVGGVIGDAIVSTETMGGATNAFASATLGSGADCTAANADGIIIAAVNAQDTSGVAASQGAGTSVLFTADAGGVAGNAIVVGKVMANASFAAAAVLLSGGVNGTVGVAGAVLVDASYLYVAIAANTLADANWRRISVGSAY